MLKKYGFSDCKPTKTLISSPASIGVDQNGANVNATMYQGMIGSLLYLTTTRLDIMFATILFSRYQSCPKESHLLAVKRIFFCYLKHTPNPGLWYPRNSVLKLLR